MKLARRSRTTFWLCGALFCCASFALGQSSDAASAEVNASVPLAEATPHVVVDASVSGTAASAYGVGSGSGRLQGRQAAAEYQGTGINLMHAENRSLEPSAAKAGSANAKRMLEAAPRRAVGGSKLSLKEAAALRTSKTGQAGTATLGATASERMATATGNETALKASSKLADAYTTDFPDSTRGTALVSPPDEGTDSPLEWSTSLDFGLPDFTKKDFLSPSLHTAGHVNNGRGTPARAFGRQRLPQSSLKGKPRVDSPETSPPSFDISVPSVDSSLTSSPDQQ